MTALDTTSQHRNHNRRHCIALSALAELIPGETAPPESLCAAFAIHPTAPPSSSTTTAPSPCCDQNRMACTTSTSSRASTHRRPSPPDHERSSTPRLVSSAATERPSVALDKLGVARFETKNVKTKSRNRPTTKRANERYAVTTLNLHNSKSTFFSACLRGIHGLRPQQHADLINRHLILQPSQRQTHHRALGHIQPRTAQQTSNAGLLKEVHLQLIQINGCRLRR